MEDINKQIDELLQIRQDGILNYARATARLMEMGVKIGDNNTKQVRVPSSFAPYIRNFNRSNMEFEWEVEYKDGTKLNQFSEIEHNFSDIDTTRLKSISWVSNFIWPTENKEKRVIVTLDWTDGTFRFQNGFISQEDRGILMNKNCSVEKKLILFTRKRVSSAMGHNCPQYRELIPPMEEFFHYNRFVIGYEVPETGEKNMLMIFPSGNVTIFNG